MILEACVDTIEDALKAEKSGADQLEWCADLQDDGLTPDYSKTLELLEKIRIPVKAMIRCRPGDFIYSDDEMQKMSEQCRQFASLPGISGLVFGATTPNGTLNTDCLTTILRHCLGKPLTVHKAIDTCRDLMTEVHRLNDLPGVEYILTSGGKSTAWEGREMILDMQKNFRGRIIAAGKINKENLATLHGYLSLGYYHGRRIVQETMKN